MNHSLTLQTYYSTTIDHTDLYRLTAFYLLACLDLLRQWISYVRYGLNDYLLLTRTRCLLWLAEPAFVIVFDPTKTPYENLKYIHLARYEAI